MKNILLFISLALLFSNCSSSKPYEDYETEKIVNLNEKIKKTLRDKTETKDFIFLDVYLMGEIKGKAKLRLYHPPYENYIEIHLEGKVNEHIRTDWYENEILLEYIPIEEVSGNLVLKYNLI